MKYLVWLQQIAGVGNAKGALLLEKYGNAQAVYNASLTDNILTVNERQRAEKFSLKEAEKILKYCQNNKIGVIGYGSSHYPNNLKNIDNPPVVLYYRGKLPDFNNKPCICIVGPRKVSEYGYKCSYSIAGRLAKAGFIVVSGGAVGSDYAAHDGSMLNGGVTVAVLANGFGYDYLKENEELRNRILKSDGCLITEFKPGTGVNKRSFHIRNRIMSGLSNGTVVVEAAEKSGALITAHHAIEQNRDLFVLPGTAGKSEYAGSNALLRDGAKPIIDLSDIFGEYLREYADKIDIEKAYDSPLKRPTVFQKVRKTNKTEKQEIKFKEKVSETSKNDTEILKNKKILPEHLSKIAKMVYNQLDKVSFTSDDLLCESISADEVLAALGELEIFGFIRSLPGGRYTLI